MSNPVPLICFHEAHCDSVTAVGKWTSFNRTVLLLCDLLNLQKCVGRAYLEKERYASRSQDTVDVIVNSTVLKDVLVTSCDLLQNCKSK